MTDPSTAPTVPRPLEPVALVGAEARFSERLSVEQPAELVTEAAVGQEVRLLLRYRINEGSPEREQFRMRLESSIGGITPPAEERTHEDRLLLHDVWLGALTHTYRFDAPGAYTGTFRGLIDYHQRDWRSGKELRTEQRRVVVPVRIEVR